MAFESVNGVRLRYELTATGGHPIVLVHGSWGSHQQWSSVVPGLAESCRVLSYDRRGHSESERERPGGQGSVLEDVADLGALIESLGLAPAYVAGNSFGSAIALRLAVERPELVRGILLHEPPLFSLLAGDPEAAPVLAEVGRAMRVVIEKLASGEVSAAVEEFMQMALAPGEWARLPEELHRIVIENAPTFLDETRDPEALRFDLEWARGFASPTLLTVGEQSPSHYGLVLAKLAEALPHAERLTFPAAGHLPHVTHPAAYVEATTAFMRDHEK